MKRLLRICSALVMLFFCAFPLLYGSGVAHALMLELSLDELTAGSDFIMLGSVTNTNSLWNDDRTAINTTVLVAVETWFKGEDEPQEIAILVPGGKVDGIGQVVSIAPSFKPGERVLLFLSKPVERELLPAGEKKSSLQTPVFKLYGNFQGKLGEPGDKTGALTQQEIVRKVQDTIHINGAKNDAGISEDEPVLVRQDSFLYEGLRWPGDWPEVDFKINTSGGPADNSNAIITSATTWNNGGAKFSFVYGGTHARAGKHYKNNVNEITWYDSGPINTLAYVSTWYLDRGSFYEIIECDMVFNTYHPWSAASATPPHAFDVATIALHEFGHFLHLGDLYDPQYSNRVMYSYGSPGQQKRALHPGDIAGIRHIYGTAQYALLFHVKNEADEPLAGVLVTLDGEGVLTGSDGTALLTGLAAGNYNYSVSKAGFVAASGAVTIADRDISVVIVLEELVIPTVTVGSDVGLAGTVVTIPITIDTFAGISSYGITIEYDPAVLTPVPAAAGGGLNGDILPDDFFMYNESFTGSSVRVGNYAGTASSTGNTLATLMFAINAAAPAGQTELTIIQDLICDGANVKVATNIVSGSVEVIEVLYGDLDGDGMITPNDASLAFCYFMGFEEFDASQFNAADVDGDGMVTPNDASLIFRHFMGFITAFPVEVI